MWMCCAERSKSSEQREYERLREALQRKQREVAKLQAECAALGATGVEGVHDTPPHRQVPRDYVDEADGAR